MVHKKSEYRLQYHLLPKELRKQIWQDNISLRLSRKSLNQAHHYWEFQVCDDECDCDDNESEGEDEGPQPPHRLKHKSLLARYGKHHLQETPDQEIYTDHERSLREIAVQTPEWKTDEECSRSDAMDKDVALPGHKDTYGKESPPLPVRSEVSVPKIHRSRTSVSPVRPSRTSRKLHSQGKKTHFVPFGWNDSQIEVGKKKTYNVCAPEKEVHNVAMQASQRRKAEIEKFLSEEMERRKRALKPQSDINANHSSIWISEYRDKFSCNNLQKKQSQNKPGPTQTVIRPVSAPPATRRPIACRYS